ncbi:MAG TPA: 2TM domain-containing protein [Acidimicrobiales bacterium]|nr:2TM domain-containing protein [Acidimicrobiales bacterium]
MLPVERVERSERLQRAARTAFVVHARTYVVINAFLIAVWAMSGAGYFWPAWVIMGWGLAVVLQAMATFARSSND